MMESYRGLIKFLNTESPSLPQLLIELKDITDWRPLGMYLHVPRSKLNAIEAQYLHSQGTGRCKEEVLSAWLRGNPDASWKEIVNALNLIDEQTLAGRLSKKYLQPAFDGSQANDLQPGIDGNQL